ncbi:sensor histidine kinase [Streptosporangium roseum]|uniref:sensor histidine kinase n=1 Tax=Streptosporangium roseum TaxID=2001 RepID=UPI0033228299
MTRRSLRTTVALAFACLVALATAVVGGLSYGTAAGMVRADEESVFVGVVNDLRIQVRQGRFTAEDFTTDNPRRNVLPKLLDATRITIQVLGPRGTPVGDERPVPLPFDRADRVLAPEQRAGAGNQREVALGGSRYRTATVALGDGRGAIRIAQRLSDTQTLLSQLRQYIMLLAGAVVVIAAAAGWWLARRAALQRAISNLLDNAVKFDPDGTQPIELIADGSRIEVRDRGPGIEEDDLERVFDRFYRAVATRALPGSGLGLALVKDVALRHSGTPFAANRPNGGAIVGFTLGE